MYLPNAAENARIARLFARYTRLASEWDREEHRNGATPRAVRLRNLSRVAVAALDRAEQARFKRYDPTRYA